MPASLPSISASCIASGSFRVNHSARSNHSSPLNSLDRTAVPAGSDRRGVLPIALFFCLLTVILGAMSNGVHHDDDLVHFLMARWSWTYPAYLLHIWGRPGATIPMALVSGIGDIDLAWHLARVVSSVTTALSAIAAAEIATSLGLRKPWRVVAACYMQPFCTLLGFTTLTENFTAFYLVTSTLLFLKGRPNWASVVFSMALLTRHEALIFLPFWWLLLLAPPAYKVVPSLASRIFTAVLALWSPVVHNLLYRLVLGAWPVQIFLQPRGSTEYPATGWSDYVPDLLYAITPLVAVLAAAGAAVFLRRERVGNAEGSFRRAETASAVMQGWIVLVPLLFVVAHSAIRAFGVFASGGFPRFMVAVAPFIAVLAVAGWDRLRSCGENAAVRNVWWVVVAVWLLFWAAIESEWQAGRLPVIHPDGLLAIRCTLGMFVLASILCLVLRPARRLPFARGFLTFLLLFAIAQCVLIVRPLRPKPGRTVALNVVRWILDSGQGDRPAFAANPWVVYGLGLIEDPRSLKNAELLASMPAGTIVVWDSAYSGSDYHGIADSDFLRLTAYQKLFEFDGRPEAPRFLIFEKIEPTPPPEIVRPSYPPPLNSNQPPVRGIFYQRERSRPSGW